MPNRRIGDPKGAREFRGIPGLAMIMSQHLPEAVQGRGSNVDPELWNGPFEKIANETPSPFMTFTMGRGKEGAWKAAP